MLPVRRCHSDFHIDFPFVITELFPLEMTVVSHTIRNLNI